MRLILSFLVVFVLSLSAAYAAVPFEEAREKALRAVPGELVYADKDMQQDGLVYKFQIRTERRNVMEVVIDSETGNVNEIRFEQRDPDTPLPESTLNEEEAVTIALEHVNTKGHGYKPQKLSVDHGFIGMQFVFIVEVGAGAWNYDIYVNADTGEVLKALNE